MNMIFLKWNPFCSFWTWYD